MKKAIVMALFAAVAVQANDKPKRVYKTVQVSDTEVILVCSNGGDPTFKNISKTTVLISCGATIKAQWNGRQFVCPKEAPYVWADEGEALDHASDYVYCGPTALLK